MTTTTTPTGLGGGGGGGGGPSPSEIEFEWNVERDSEQLDSGHDAPTGAWSDGTLLWLAQNGSGVDDAVYAYDLGTGERVADREFELAESNRAPRGLWSNEVTAWVADSGQNRLFAYDLESGERDEEREVVLDTRNRAPRGIWSDRETVWVLDGGKNALFAYDIASGELLAEYALDSGNGNPQGLWSDGDVMYVVDASDGKVYTYNMPDAIDARLASLTLSGIDIGEFVSDRPEYTGVVGDGVTETTVEAEAAQRGATVAIEPSDADEAADGHQAALEGVREITATVTSADGSRMRVYHVGFEESGPASDCLRGAVAVGFSILIYEGGSVGDLVGCAESRHVTALYALDGGAYVSYILGTPEFVNRSFLELYAEGVPATTLVIARSDGPPTADPSRDDVAVQSWPECLRGDISAGFSLVLYEGGSVEELGSCAQDRHVAALYTLEGGVYAAYILGAPEFVNAGFREVFPDGLPAATPLIAKSEEGSTS